MIHTTNNQDLLNLDENLDNLVDLPLTTSEQVWDPVKKICTVRECVHH